MLRNTNMTQVTFVSSISVLGIKVVKAFQRKWYIVLYKYPRHLNLHL